MTLSESKLKCVDRIISSAIGQVFPGAVLLVGTPDGILLERTYGTLDDDLPTSFDTLYDLASLTKVIATTTAIMRLVEECIVHLNDKVGDFLDVDGEKAQVTIFELLTHTSGLQPYSDLWKYMRGHELKEALIKIQPTCKGKMQYSCLNFVTLMAIVEKITGKTFDEYVLEILNLPNTTFRPKDVQRCAPTSEREGKRLRGEPDDEIAYYLGGVSGNAGLFSTARDIHTFVVRLLNGQYASKRIVRYFTQTIVTDPNDSSMKRHIGWMAPVKGGSAGDFADETMFGHTGFTGTSLWVTRDGLHVIFLTNKVFYNRWDDRIQRIRILLHNAIFGQLLE